jgi:hypothetical protein
MRLTGGQLMQAIADRILVSYLVSTGATGVMRVDQQADPSRFRGVDIVYTSGGTSRKVKVKPDSYFGTDPRKIADQSLVFYRSPASAYAFETISHHVTRDPGWIFNSAADELFYYFLAIAQPEDEVSALMDEPDEVFFSELAVERDELHVLPMGPLRDWFDSHGERYMPRPVTLGDYAAWYRIIPVRDIDGIVPGVETRGSIFARLLKG